MIVLTPNGAKSGWRWCLLCPFVQVVRVFVTRCLFSSGVPGHSLDARIAACQKRFHNDLCQGGCQVFQSVGALVVTMRWWEVATEVCPVKSNHKWRYSSDKKKGKKPRNQGASAVNRTGVPTISIVCRNVNQRICPLGTRAGFVFLEKPTRKDKF